MTVRLSARLAAAGISAALAAGGVTLASVTPAHAAESGGTATYACHNVLGSIGTINVIPGLPTSTGNGTATLPIDAVLDGVIGDQGLVTDVLKTLTTALGVPLSPVTDGVQGGAETLEGVLSLPIDQVTNTLPVPLPSTLDLGVLPGILGVTCDLVAPLDALPLPSLPGTDATPDPTPTPTPTPKPTPKPAPKSTTTKKPTKKPAKHAATMTAKSVKWQIHHTAHPKVRIQVKTQGHGAKGKVVAHVGKRLVGQGWLKNGRLTLVLKKLARGKRSVRINYLGNSAVRATHRWVSYKIIK
ncbi:hypothetical protein AB3X52_11815 [Nocardioides sp. DS6]|uniref:Uncharacterized protein n=1 Tax=Nocardioides eburneus TaxID=3231482 RepID=A0ABV3SZD7_9ACTN